MTHVIRHIAAFAFYLALAIAMTWPLATHLSTAVPDLGDPLLNAWIVDWVCHALTHAPLQPLRRADLSPRAATCSRSART